MNNAVNARDPISRVSPKYSVLNKVMYSDSELFRRLCRFGLVDSNPDSDLVDDLKRYEIKGCCRAGRRVEAGRYPAVRNVTRSYF